MWHRVEVVLTDVSEERISSIFMVEGKIRKSAHEASVRDVKSSLLFTAVKTSNLTSLKLVIGYLNSSLLHLLQLSHSAASVAALSFLLSLFFPCIQREAI
jgi:hypothetical protein